MLFKKEKKPEKPDYRENIAAESDFIRQMIIFANKNNNNDDAGKLRDLRTVVEHIDKKLEYINKQLGIEQDASKILKLVADKDATTNSKKEVEATIFVLDARVKEEKKREEEAEKKAKKERKKKDEEGKKPKEEQKQPILHAQPEISQQQMQPDIDPRIIDKLERAG